MFALNFLKSYFAYKLTASKLT